MKQKFIVLFLLGLLLSVVSISGSYAQEKRPAGFDPNALSKFYGAGNNSGVTVNRSRAEHGSALGAGAVHDTTQPMKKICPCRGSDYVKLGSFCAPQGYIYDNPPAADWNTGVVYMPGQFAC